MIYALVTYRQGQLACALHSTWEGAAQAALELLSPELEYVGSSLTGNLRKDFTLIQDAIRDHESDMIAVIEQEKVL